MARETERGWPDRDILVAVEAYLDLLVAQGKGERPSKVEATRRLLEGPLSHRTRGSVEYKFGNVSAVLDEHALPWVRGYSPYGNYQRARFPDHVLRLARKWGIEKLDEIPTADPGDLEERARRLRGRGRLRRPKGRKRPKKTRTRGESFVRDPAIVAWVLRAAKAICECCRKPAPFSRREGDPYLEVHHVVRLAEGGPDIVENAVALCPNCHRELHYGGRARELRQKLYRSVTRLRPSQGEEASTD